jgi:hypothetical protein
MKRSRFYFPIHWYTCSISTLYKQAPAFTEFKVLQYEVSHYLALHNILKKGQGYEIIVYSKEPGRHKTLYFQSLLLK